MFAAGTPISEIRFGSTTHRLADYKPPPPAKPTPRKSVEVTPEKLPAKTVPTEGTTAKSTTPEKTTPVKTKATSAKSTSARSTSAKSTSAKSTSAKSTTPRADVDPPAPRGGKGGLATGTALVKTTAEGATGAMMSKALSELNQLAAQNPGDKDLGEAVKALNDTLDAKSFVENPTGFLAAKGKDAIIQGVFNHFAESLDATRRSFVGRFPDVATLHQDPVHNGVSLEEYRQTYRKTLEALRIPAARHAIFYAAVLVGLPEDAPPEEVERRIALANRELAKLPGTASYVARFHEAQDRYTFALAAATNDLNLRGDALAALPEGLAEDLRRRADALHQIGSILDHLQQDLWNSRFVVWAPILAAQQDLESLAKGFTGLGSSMSGLADVVSGRQGEYSRELDRLADEARRVAAQSTRAFTLPARDAAKQ